MAYYNYADPYAGFDPRSGLPYSPLGAYRAGLTSFMAPALSSRNPRTGAVTLGNVDLVDRLQQAYQANINERNVMKAMGDQRRAQQGYSPYVQIRSRSRDPNAPARARNPFIGYRDYTDYMRERRSAPAAPAGPAPAAPPTRRSFSEQLGAAQFMGTMPGGPAGMDFGGGMATGGAGPYIRGVGAVHPQLGVWGGMPTGYGGAAPQPGDPFAGLSMPTMDETFAGGYAPQPQPQQWPAPWPAPSPEMGLPSGRTGGMEWRTDPGADFSAEARQLEFPGRQTGASDLTGFQMEQLSEALRRAMAGPRRLARGVGDAIQRLREFGFGSPSEAAPVDLAGLFSDFSIPQQPSLPPMYLEPGMARIYSSPGSEYDQFRGR